MEDDRLHADARICVLSFPRLCFPSSLCSLFGRDESAPLHSTAAATRRAHSLRAHLFINIYLSISSSSLSLSTILYPFLSDFVYSSTIYIICFSPYPNTTSYFLFPTVRESITYKKQIYGNDNISSCLEEVIF